MKKHYLVALLASIAAAPLSAQPAATGNDLIGANSDLVQVSTINALIKGDYDGSVPMDELKQMGDFGIGTFDHLDGEMVALDGHVYQARGDGRVIEVPDSTTTPFASMTKFSADTTTEGMSATSYDELKKAIDSGLPSENLFYAVKVTGNFPAMKVRSVTRQEPPYRPLTEVVNDQKLFDFAETSGTLIGFRCPEYVQGVNVAGYHLHYLSADKTQGGHVLEFEMAEGRVEVDRLSNFSMMLPQSEHFLDMDLSEKNEEAIHKVEKLSGEPEKK